MMLQKGLINFMATCKGCTKQQFVRQQWRHPIVYVIALYSCHLPVDARGSGSDRTSPCATVLQVCRDQLLVPDLCKLKFGQQTLKNMTTVPLK